MKTAMQELIDELRDYKRTTFSDKLVVTYWIVIAEKLLEKEKQHIINAVNTTEKEAVDFCNEAVLKYYNHEGLFGVVPDAGINYYNEIYNDNE